MTNDVTKILSGFGWLSLLKVFMKGLTLLKIVVIARILSPRDLGLFGIATIILSLIEVMTETGINTFLIQKKEGIEKYVNTAWIISIGRGILISIVISGLSFFLAHFYNEPELLGIILVVACIPLIKGFINPAVIIFQKRMQYHKYALLRSAIFVCEITAALALSILMHQAIGLVIAMVFAAIVEVFLSQLLISPRPKFMASRKQVSEILHFGKWLNLSGVFAFLGNNADDLIVGKILGTSQLGFYQTAFNVTQSTVGEVGDLASQTLFPIYSSVYTNTHRLRKILASALIPLALILCIPSLLLLFFPTQLVGLILGEKWLSIIPILPWLLGAAYFQALNGATYPIFLAVFKPHYTTITVFLNLAVLLVLILPLTYMYGLVGVGIAVFLAKLSVQPIYVYFAWKTLWKK